MKFFTPDLYLRFNSADDAVADAANEDWEEALAAYRSHLERIYDGLPTQLRKLTELDLHDRELLSFEKAIPFMGFSSARPNGQSGWSTMAILSLGRTEEIVTLVYTLSDQIRETPKNAEWPFSRVKPHWLYDEIDRDAGRDLSGHRQVRYVHRILLSDGQTLEIPFFSVAVHTIPMTQDGRIRQSA
jgi:hypothetical protein